MLTTACCFVVRLGVGLDLVSGWLVHGYTHVFILFSVVILALPVSPAVGETA